MVLPEYVKQCMDALESAGYAAYAVGGCVRDACLGLIPHDYDLCTAAPPDRIKEVFAHRQLVLAGEKHGTVAVVTEKGLVEITTFRTEGGYTDNRHPAWVAFVPTVEQDLARRDFTVNAMAFSPTRGFSDPFGGREDLKNHVLRAVGDPAARFEEDSLRILRGVRFAVRFHLTPEDNTLQAMHALAPLMDNLARERVFDELCKLLLLVSADDLIRFAPVITQVIPELAPAVGFDQHSVHHVYDLYTHIAHVTAAVPATLPLRWAALLHDAGKVATYVQDAQGHGHFYGHAKVSAQMADRVLLRLKAPAQLREQVVQLIELHMTYLEPEKKLMRRRLGKWGVDTVLDLLKLQEADMCSKGTGKADETAVFGSIRQMIDELLDEDACLTVQDLAVNGNDLIRIGFVPGRQIGTCLSQLLALVQDDALENKKETLLSAAEAMLRDLNTGGTS